VSTGLVRLGEESIKTLIKYFLIAIPEPKTAKRINFVPILQAEDSKYVSCGKM
jgi:hypothetical protein